MNHFEIVITQSILLDEDLILRLGAEGARFVTRIRDKDPKWFGWTELTPDQAERIRGFEEGSVLRQLAFVSKYDVALCERVHNHQCAADVGLPHFWTDPEQRGVSLVQRSYSLLATDYGQFLLVLCFRFEGGSPKDQTLVLRDICTDRAIRSHTDQRVFSRKATSDVDTEVDRLFGKIVAELKANDQERSATAAPRTHGTAQWLWSDEDLTGYPWILAGALGPEVMDIVTHERAIAADEAYHDPERGNPYMLVSSNFTIYCEKDETRPMRLELVPLFVFMQASYYTVRQLQSKIQSEMEAAPTGRYNDELVRNFDRFSLNFERYLLGYEVFTDSRINKIRTVFEKIDAIWHLGESNERLSAGIDRQQSFIRSQHQDESLREAKRHEGILFVIAMLQLFALISVLADYRALNDAAGEHVPGSGELAFESWLIDLSPWHLRILLAITFGVTLWLYAPRGVRMARRMLRRLRQRRSAAAAQTRVFPEVPGTGLEVRPSNIHRDGLWTRRGYSSGEQIIEIDAGEPVAISPHEDLSGEHWHHEWNATPGFLFVRRGTGTPYRLINHSRSPNAEAEVDPDAGKVRVRALRDLSPDEEVCIDYRAEPLTRPYIVERGGYL